MQAPANAAYLQFRLKVRPNTVNQPGWAAFVRPMVSEAVAGQTDPTPWSPGRDPDLFAAIKETATVRVATSGGTGPDEAGATYIFKVRAGTRYSNADGGFGISALPDGSGGYMSDFRIFADRFAIMQNSLDGTPGNANHPFVVTGGAVYIRQAFIKDADITRAKIQDLAVDTLKIAGDSVTSWKMGAEAATLMRSVYDGRATSVGLNTNWKMVDALSIAPDRTGRLLVTYSALLRANPGSQGIGYWVRILINGTERYARQFRVDNQYGFSPVDIAFSRNANENAGNYYVQIQIKMNSLMYSGVPEVENRCLTVFSAKR